MKIVIVVLIVLLAFLGFQVYGIVTQEIEEAQISSIQTIDNSEVKTISVDKVDDMKSYTHRVSTYEHQSNNLVTAASNYLLAVDYEQYITIYYYLDDQLIQEEYAVDSDVIALKPLAKELIIVLSDDEALKTNLTEKEMTFYSNEGLHVIHVEPKQTGRYEISFNDTMITFENLEKK